MTIGGVTAWAGDRVVQALDEEEENSSNTKRSAAFMSWGALMGAFGHVWYNRMAAIPYMVAYPASAGGTLPDGVHTSRIYWILHAYWRRRK